MSVFLREIATSIHGAALRGDGGTPIADLAYDSRSVGPGTLFFCVRGTRTDGHEHARAAIEAGAVALVVDHPLDIETPQVIVPEVRPAMGPIASTFFGHPSRAMTLVGITGTNGKTTTTFLMESAFKALGMSTGLIGTVETHVAGQVEPAGRTTPEGIDLQRLLSRMRDAGIGAAAMEVSSEGLAQGRADGTRFTAAAFTNLSQDHLNFHGTMEAYFQAKSRLFTPEMAGRAIVNADDPYGRRLVDETMLPVTTFALDTDADVRASSIELHARGSDVVAEVAGRRVELHVALNARYNVSNALAALALAHALGLPLDAAAEGIGAVRGVPGRLERVDAGQDFTVLVDYAHTPDSVEGVLRAAREVTPTGARLLVVLGCGGDRDRAKRPLMGRAAVSLADHTIITSDNPRSEDPLAIIAEIEAGARGSGSYETEPDRGRAIASAVAAARTGDVVVIAGKGHESGQEFADEVIPFDDRVVAGAAIRERLS